jgi:hypothetical protein
MNRLLSELLGLLVAMGTAATGLAEDQPAASPAAITVADAKGCAQVEWDPATRKCRIRWSAAPVAAIRFSQQWFVGEVTPIVDLVAQPPRELSEREIVWTERSKSRRVELEYSLSAGDAVACRVRVVQHGKRPLTLRWQQEVEGFPAGGTLFAPSPEGLYPLARQEVNVGYRDGHVQLSIPMATWFDERADVGLTVAAHLAMPTAGFRVQAEGDKGRIVLSRTVLNLEPGEACTVGHYFVRHAGDWRPGLAWVRRQFSKFFMLGDRRLLSTHGCFTYSHEADEKACDEFVREGLRNLEIHFTYSHLGKYFPDEQPWIKAIDDKWSVVKKTNDPAAPKEDAPYEEIKRYMSRVVESRGNWDSVRAFIRRLKARGIHSYIYFQPTESWEFFANARFPECILRHADGRPATTWYDHVVMDCRPETAWGKHLCRQLEQVLDALPEVDGIFMDQSAGDRHDYSVCRITDKLARIAEARGKLLYWNGPYQVELIEHAMGMLAEGGSLQGEMIKYLTIGDKVCCGMGTTERQYQRNLLNGLWPSAPSLVHEQTFRYDDDPVTFLPLPPELVDVHRRYMYLYELYPGKVWYLGAHPLQAPAGVQANIFQRPDGDYLVPLIVPQRTLHDEIKPSPVRLKVRIPDAGKIRGVYGRTPHTPKQQFAVAWTRAGGTVEITLPWLGSACLLWISKAEQPATPAPSAPQPERQAPQAAASPIMSASISCEGFVPTGAVHRVKTKAPLPPVPVRRCSLNGHHVGSLHSRNYRSWHGGTGIGLPNDILSFLKEENELVIEPAGPDDFFKLRNLQMSITLADGRTIAAEPVRATYSSCAGPLAEGVIGSPLRIPIRFPRWKELSGAATK